MPIVSLKMGASLNPDYIKEGDSVYFECNTTANPKPYKMTWYHNVSIRRDTFQQFAGGITIRAHNDNRFHLHHVDRLFAGVSRSECTQSVMMEYMHN